MLTRLLTLGWLIFSTTAIAEPSDAELGEWQDTIRKHAQTLAEAPYSPPNHTLPQALQSLDYDTYRQIRFDPTRAYWGDDSRFSLQLFHSGFLFPHPVELNLVEGDKAQDTQAFAFTTRSTRLTIATNSRYSWARAIFA